MKDCAYKPFEPLEQFKIVKDDPTLSIFTLPKNVDVSPLACVIHKILRYNLLPRTGGGADFTCQYLVLIVLILKGITFNLFLMRMKNMGNCLKQTKKCMPYGGFLIKKFQHFEISLDNEASVSLIESIDSKILKSSHLSFVNGKFMSYS